MFWMTRVVVIIVLMLSAVMTATAASTIGHVGVTILEPIALSESTTMDFGAIPANDGTCSLNETGSLVGTDGSECDGTGQLGEFAIIGSEDQQVSIAVTSGSSVEGITFEPVLHSASTPTLEGGSATVKIGGDLLLSSAPVGQQLLTYFITVNYN